MPTTRTLIAVVAAAPLSLGLASADAAVKKPPVRRPVCNVVKDGGNDATGTGTAAAGPNDPNLDITSADVATNAKTLTAVIRVASMDGSGDTSPGGRGYDLTFTVRKTVVLVRGIVTPTGESWAGGNGTGKVDKAKKEVRISVPLAKLPVAIKPNDKITEIEANTWRYVGTSIPMGRVDHGTTTTSYVAGWPSCVPIGS